MNEDLIPRRSRDIAVQPPDRNGDLHILLSKGANLNVQSYLIASLRKRGAIPPVPEMSLWLDT